MKKNPILFVCIAFTLFLCSCSGNTPPIPEEPKRLILVFADLTGSMNLTGVEAVAEKIHDLTMRLDPGATMVVKLIDDDNSEPIARIVVPEIQQGIDSELREINKVRTEAATHVRDTLIHSFKNTPSRQRNTSCILNAMEFAYSFFRVKDAEVYNFELVFVSDMIEECSMEHGILAQDLYMIEKQKKDAPTFVEMEEKVKGQFLKSNDLGQFVSFNDVKCVLTINEAYNNIPGCMNQQELRLLWECIFCELGLDSTAKNQLHFDTELPSNFKLPE